MITIRQFQCGEEAVLRKLMFDTIRSVTIKHYSDNQVKAWAHTDIADESWQDRLRSNQPLVAVLNGKIVGFADIQANGLIDHFFLSCRTSRPRHRESTYARTFRTQQNNQHNALIFPC